MDKPIGGGLLELPVDERDFQFGQLFTLPSLDEIPHEFYVSKPLKIKDQGDSDLCTAFAATSVSEDQEAIPSPRSTNSKRPKRSWVTSGPGVRTSCCV